jgi:hypothetical protein
MKERGNREMDLKSLLQKKAKIESDIARAKKQEKDAKRRAETRSKIILGGVLIAAVREGAFSENAVRGLVSKFASDRDKAAFEDFEFESGEAVSAVSETAAAVHAPDASGDSVRE